VYFSPRRSSAPDTGNGAAAEAASAGAGAVAGAGAAWLWTGTPGEPLDYRCGGRDGRSISRDQEDQRVKRSICSCCACRVPQAVLCFS